jgi:hypothetical protein
VKAVRPDPWLLWPAYTLFPLALLSVLFFAVAGRDTALTVIAIGLLALNGAIVVNQLYFTSLALSGDELVYRSWAGLQEQRVAVGSIQRIDAKRYSGAHGGASAPHLVARGRDTTVRVNTKPYRLRDIGALIDAIRAANPRVELDAFWSDVARGDEPSKEIAVTPRSRF